MATDQATAMDHMYRYQRYIYDLTRKYYLLGRDKLIEQMPVSKGMHILEMGTGTGRNLMLLAQKHPDAHFYGLDASEEMLVTARQKLARSDLQNVQAFTQCLAEDLHHETTFGVAQPFDAIFFSYALSMIPPWRQALHAAIENLAPHGSIYIVDFWDQGDLPGWFRAILQRWLHLFHVHHKPELLECLELLHTRRLAKLELTSLHRRYAYIATVSEFRRGEELRNAILQEPETSAPEAAPAPAAADSCATA